MLSTAGGRLAEHADKVLMFVRVSVHLRVLCLHVHALRTCGCL
jgi:hypothetical protein